MEKFPKDLLNRRGFLKLSGGIAISLYGGLLFFRYNNNTTKEPKSVKINPWVHIKTDNTIVIYNPAAEMGQGSMTALPAILAEEMDADWSKVIIEDSPIDAEVYGHDGWGYRQMMAIVGSYAVEGYYETLRNAGAQVRMILLEITAKEWKVKTEELTTENGFVIDKKKGERISYGDIASLKRVPDVQVKDMEFKQPKNYQIIGKPFNRKDIPDKVNGKATFSIDVKLPSMVYGSVLHSPMYKGEPISYNEDEISRMLNVLKVIRLENAVGIIAKTAEAAFEAKRRLKIHWNSTIENQNYNSDNDVSEYRSRLKDSSYESVEILSQSNGKVGPVKKTYTREYFNDYVYHAQLEPLNAVVSISNNRKSAEIWLGTQAPDSALAEAARTLEIAESNITLHRCYLGGGFGRRTRRDFLIDTCQLAKHTDSPLKLMWSREDDFTNGVFRPNCLQHIIAQVNQDNDIVSWDYTVVGPGKALLHTGSKTPYYYIRNQKIKAKYMEPGINTGSWRGEGHGANKFAIECFLDEISSDLGFDPFEFRKKMMKGQKRALQVLKITRKLSKWDDTLPPDRAKGLSFCERNSMTACVCEISLNQSNGKIRVHKVWLVIDAGLVISPKNAVSQIEGGIIMGISSTLMERISFSNGQVEQQNFDDYPILRMADVPEEINVEFIPSTESPTGIGEAGVPGIGGAIANAFAKLTGKRLHHMPFTPKRVLETLS